MTRRLSVLLVLLMVGGCRNVTAPSIQAEYLVQGTARHASVTMQTDANRTEQRLVTIPFTAAYLLHAGDTVFLSAQIDTPGDRGTVNITIKKNGQVFRTGIATGYPNTATATGTF